jgi:hypothetical protein
VRFAYLTGVEAVSVMFEQEVFLYDMINPTRPTNLSMSRANVTVFITKIHDA